MSSVVPDIGARDFPNESERNQYSAYLSNPMAFPGEFKAWLSDWLAVNVPYIPVSQISGYTGTVAQISIVNDYDTEPTGSQERVWQDIQHDGPVLNNLNPGVYFVCYGYQDPGLNAGAQTVRVGISVNGADPTRYITSTHLDLGWNNWEAIVIDLTTTGVELNTLKMKYWWDLSGGAEAEFQYRWLMAMRIT